MIFQERKVKGEFNLFLKEINLHDDVLVFPCFRMSTTIYEQVLTVVTPGIGVLSVTL